MLFGCSVLIYDAKAAGLRDAAEHSVSTINEHDRRSAQQKGSGISTPNVLEKAGWNEKRVCAHSVDGYLIHPLNEEFEGIDQLVTRVLIRFLQVSSVRFR